jgi:hypothetical protein
MNDSRVVIAQEIYERTMCRLRVAIRLLAVVLLALVARGLIDGLTAADVISGTVIALLLIASVGLWRQGRRIRPDAGPRQAVTTPRRVRGRAG